ncbi:recombinase family protein [Streptomyces sp. JV185]|uniref:recombinase family protein n=1 Tax=Streptomyces sp. JV185 TaxID=858638 RepID=UPI002E77A5B7|nr:recombinase family protein [Streptomyces sp. JV185]MEE1769303.1 recombinase family protein [Streptomyces sp. JV185]
MEAVDDVASGDHVGGGEDFEGLALAASPVSMPPSARRTGDLAMLDRLGRKTVELITRAQDLAEHGHRLEIRTGPLAGIYHPHGAGKVLFVVFAAMAEVEREFVHERTLVGLDTAAANGNHGGRPPAVDGGRRRHPRRHPRPPRREGVRHRHRRAPRRRPPHLHRTLSAYDEAAATTSGSSRPAPCTSHCSGFPEFIMICTV